MTKPSVSALLAYGLEQQAKSGAVHERDAGEVQQDLTCRGCGLAESGVQNRRGRHSQLIANAFLASWTISPRVRSAALEWSAESARTRVEDGIDTFVFRDGLIRVQIR